MRVAYLTSHGNLGTWPGAKYCTVLGAWVNQGTMEIQYEDTMYWIPKQKNGREREERGREKGAVLKRPIASSYHM
jgi:hypothetical protein